MVENQMSLTLLKACDEFDSKINECAEVPTRARRGFVCELSCPCTHGPCFLSMRATQRRTSRAGPRRRRPLCLALASLINQLRIAHGTPPNFPGDALSM